MPFTLIQNGTLIDGNGGRPVANAAVLVENKVIRAAGPRQALDLPHEFPHIIDAQGGYILPGLIDTHVHVMSEGYDLAKHLMTPFSYRFYEVIDRMRRTLDAGVTTVRDAAGADLGIKQAVEKGLVTGPRLMISVAALSTTGGHGDSWMPSGIDVGEAYPGKPGGVCDGVQSVRQKVREVLRAGADVIKVSVTGGVLSPTDRPEFTQFSQEELAVMVEEGRYRGGIKVMAHAQGAEGIKQAIRAGIHSIEHGIFLDDEVIELMLQRGTFLVPTLIAPIAVVEMAERTGVLPEALLQKAKDVIDIHRASAARAYKAGVTIAMGTDSGVGPHGTNLRELGLMCAIGMSPMEAIVATSSTAARCLGWEKKVGSVEAGKLADVIVVATDPLADIRSLENTQNVRVVIKDGQVVKDIRPQPEF